MDFVSVNDFDLKNQVVTQPGTEHETLVESGKRKFDEVEVCSQIDGSSPMNSRIVLDRKRQCSGDDEDPGFLSDEEDETEDSSSEDGYSTGSIHSSCSICLARQARMDEHSNNSQSSSWINNPKKKRSHQSFTPPQESTILRAEVEIHRCSNEELVSKHSSAFQALRRSASSVASLGVYDVTINWISESADIGGASQRFSTMAFLSPLSATLPRAGSQRVSTTHKLDPVGLIEDLTCPSAPNSNLLKKTSGESIEARQDSQENPPVFV